MLVSGEIENVPLLDVIQVVAYSKQTGILAVGASNASGTLIFEGGGIVCGSSSSTTSLLARAAAENDRRTRLALRRLGTLAVLTELLSLRSGAFRFQGAKAPVAELAGVALGAFYEAGPMDTGELLLLVATSIDKPEVPPSASAVPPREQERSHARYSPTLIPASLTFNDSNLAGHLTNLSQGGACFHGEALPPAESLCELRFILPGELGPVDARARAAWVRPDATSGPRAAGLAFVAMTNEGRGKLTSYLARYQSLAEEYLEPSRENVRS